jgi:hypothetical protein
MTAARPNSKEKRAALQPRFTYLRKRVILRVNMRMAKKSTNPVRKPVPHDRPTGQKPVALTVKLDGLTYGRLGTLRASQRRTHQDILKQALQEYLDRQGA